MKTKYLWWNKKRNVWTLIIVINEGVMGEEPNSIVKFGIYIFGKRILAFYRYLPKWY